VAARKTTRQTTRARSGATRTPKATSALAARIAALEDRVARLETGRPPPGDGRRAAPRPRAVLRCPGCGLPLRTQRGRCAGCGRPVGPVSPP